MKSIKILGLRVDNVNYDETIDLIQNFIKSRKPHQICTINPEFIMEAQKDEEFKYILNNSSLNVPDGGGLLFAAQFTKQKLNSIVHGMDLVDKITRLSVKKHYRIFLLGGEDGSGNKAKKILEKKFPGINIVGAYEGFPIVKPISKKIWQKNYRIRRNMDLTKKTLIWPENEKIIKKITSKRPDILLVAYGAPKQDKFIARYLQYLRVPVMIGVGGSFDYISGKVHRAPLWMRNLHLEWLYRLILQPKKRFGRIITATIRFPWKVLTTK